MRSGKLITLALTAVPLLLLTIFASCSKTYMAGESDKPCDVKAAQLKGSYEGTCKNGLAHGEGEAEGADRYVGDFKHGLPHGNGTYYWSNGARFEGHFENGQREGKGTFYYAKGDSVKQGYWVAGEYIGNEKVEPYVINRNRSVRRTRFVKMGDSKNQVEILIQRSGSNIMGQLEDLRLNYDSGTRLDQMNAIYLQDVVYPFEGQVAYRVPNEFQAAMIDCNIRFTINEPGYWQVYLIN